MITKKQAMAADYFHLGDCTKHVGPRGGVKLVISNWRRSGRTKLWMRRLDDFRVPVKYGLRSHGYVTAQEAHEWHVPEDCPVKGE